MAALTKTLTKVLSLTLPTLLAFGEAVTPVSASQSTLAASPWGFAADGSTESTVTVTAKDASGTLLEDRSFTASVVASAVDASLSTVTAAPTSVASGVSSTITLTVLDASGNPLPGIPAAQCVLAVTGSTNTVTQPIGVTDRNGRITGSFSSTTEEAKTASFTVLGLAITDTAGVTVEAASSGDGEPVFNPATDTDLLGVRDGSFDSYGAIGDVPFFTFSGASVITPGRNGSGNALRMPVSEGSGESAYGVAITIAVTTHVVLSFYFRTDAGADFTSGRFDQSGTKWVMLKRDAESGTQPRCTLGVHSLQGGILDGPADNGVQFEFRDQSVTPPGSIMQNVSKAVGWNATNEQGTTNRTSAVNDGAWHRYTVEADTLNNVAKIWVDGVLTNDAEGLTYPMADLGFDSVDIAGPVVPNMLAGFGFNLDVDDIVLFARGA